jgi:pimeloyl-ACP methyl ester carboxylesterase
MQPLRWLLCVSCVAFLSACQPLLHKVTPVWSRLEQADFERVELVTPTFALTAALRDPDRSKVLHVYIEGDGRAWVHRHRPSSDPTPLLPLAAELALRDPHPAVLYLARPCQWRPETSAGDCPPELWTSHRYSATVVQGYVLILRELASSRGSSRIALIGHSGGGALAALIAARLEGVEWLVTVAGNLDTAAWTRHHAVSPLLGSLNPAEDAARLRGLPQQHLVGGRDAIVPEAVVRAFVERGRLDPSSVAVIDEADHHCCWPERWPGLLHRFRTRAGLAVPGDRAPPAPKMPVKEAPTTAAGR